MGGILFAFRSNEKEPDIFEYVSEFNLLCKTLQNLPAKH